MPDGTLRVVQIDYDAFKAAAMSLQTISDQVYSQPPVTVNTPPWTAA